MVRGIPLITLSPFHFNALRGIISLSSCWIHSIRCDKRDIPSRRIETTLFQHLLALNPFYFNMTRGGIPSPCIEIKWFQCGKGEYPSHIESILFQHDEREYPLLSHRIFFISMQWGGSLFSHRIHSISTQQGEYPLSSHWIFSSPLSCIKSQNPSNLGGFCAPYSCFDMTVGVFPLPHPSILLKHNSYALLAFWPDGGLFII